MANNTTKGDGVYAHNWDDDEFNDLFDKDEFVYDASRNPYDKGWLANRYLFCRPVGLQMSRASFKIESHVGGGIVEYCSSLCFAKSVRLRSH